LLAASACGGAATVGGTGAPRALVVVSAARQTGLAEALAASQPIVKVTDGGGHPLAGVTVDFAVTAGGGSVAPASAVSGKDGTVTASWTLGPVGSQELRATAAAIPGVVAVLTAQAFSASGYHIDLQLLTSASDAQWAAFTAAADRISQVIVGGLTPTDVTGRTCDGVAVSGTVQNLLILVRLRSIDGPGGILGQAGPCIVRSNRLPAVGIMEFDSADLATLQANGMLQSTILHEMLHVVGFGTEWGGAGLLTGGGTASSAFIGPQGLAAAIGYNGAASSWTSVPAENCGASSPSPCGSGTRDSHWREPVFKNELMTGWLSGTSQPLSRTTVGSLEDLGYAVDLDAADPFDLVTAQLQALLAPEPAPVPLGEDVLPLPIEIVP
jgi:hypothetical protein